MNIEETINPAVLIWARETAGLSLEEAAHRIGLTSSSRSTNVEKLLELESGARSPSEAQLKKMAAAYHRPLLSFYMVEPPPAADSGEDFRTQRVHVATQDAANLEALLRDVRARQNILREMLIDEDENEKVNFVGTLSIDMPIRLATMQVKAALGIEDSVTFRKGMRKPEDLFNDLRRRTEAMRVFVILLGDLGNYRTAIASSVFRGFAISDDLAPMIIINDQDAKAAWSFTLIHELVHIFLGKTGISGAPTSSAPQNCNARVERFCNDVAGELLLPPEALEYIPRMVDTNLVLQQVESLSRQWHVSMTMAAYRLWRNRKTDADTYQAVFHILSERWQRQRAREKEKKQGASGPNYYVIRRHRLGNALLQFVGQGLRAEAVTHTAAAQILGVRPGAVEALLSETKGFGNSALNRKAS